MREGVRGSRTIPVKIPEEKERMAKLFGGRYVAVLEGIVIENASSARELLQKLDKRDPILECQIRFVGTDGIMW